MGVHAIGNHLDAARLETHRRRREPDESVALSSDGNTALIGCPTPGLAPARPRVSRTVRGQGRGDFSSTITRGQARPVRGSSAAESRSRATAARRSIGGSSRAVDGAAVDRSPVERRLDAAGPAARRARGGRGRLESVGRSWRSRPTETPPSSEGRSAAHSETRAKRGCSPARGTPGRSRARFTDGRARVGSGGASRSPPTATRR